jgi:hypothetical protein
MASGRMCSCPLRPIQTINGYYTEMLQIEHQDIKRYMVM